MNDDFRVLMKEKREHKKLSQTNLAIMIKKSPQLICDIEAGRKNPSVDTLVNIARILDISLDDIFLKKNYA
ncbi:helix-turn-helix transcriptional regulator (plasmid) [Crassaminicella thermophila]|uniref:Helix-turn-helix transcriptional regulator n=1 Tax=Crassaminicella thermophila TaxID=2599308 RepID=A0A5C0SJ68_CRATE|nr:helix-turn-helix transcriptional regulator [Crassaminicella thermophila]QEK13746.1 helix-turn-helix transcriptional regulator [Crassaminicella thermophila]